MTPTLTVRTPIGTLTLKASERGLSRVLFGAGPRRNGSPRPRRPAAGMDGPAGEALRQAAAQITDYFRGHRTAFDLPLDVEGTPFQVAVWGALRRIPYGRTRSYAQIACDIGKPDSTRAVGQACGANPLALVIPCHRVLGSGGGIGGFSAGLARKRRLLAFEGVSTEPAEAGVLER